MRKAKYRILASLILSLFMLNSCGQEPSASAPIQDSAPVSSSRSKEYHPENAAKKEAESYFEYLKQKDIQSLNKLFSSNVRNSHDLEKEWNEFFECVDGNIISCGNITYLGEEVRVDKRKVTYSDIVIRYEDVKTDSGKTYDRIDYRQLRVNDADPGSEGISIFSIKIPSEDNNDSREVSVGEISDQ